MSSDYKIPVIACGTILGVFFIIKIASNIKSYFRISKLYKIARNKKQSRDQQIKDFKIPELDLTDDFKEKLLQSDATTLLELLQSNKVTSTQLTTLFIQRAASIGKDLEIITEINFEEAIAQAKLCDEIRKKDPTKCKGRLFGLPMSIKDCFYLKGKDSSGGIITYLNNPASDDGLIVKILKSEGAIPFVKTNVPQLMMMSESGNHIWGRTKNPWDHKRCVGGSSGGEGAILAAGCSPLGLGNDIGGSGRIPATFCGVVGFKPTHETIIPDGACGFPELEGIYCMRVSHCPMGKTVDDVNLLMKTFLENEYLKSLGPYSGNVYHEKRVWREEIVHDQY